MLPAGVQVLDLGCGAGIPATRELTGHGLQVLGVDFSAVQLRRARRLVPSASLVQADMTELRLRSASLDAVVSFYALIHVPLADQQVLFPRVRSWLRPAGYFLATVGAGRWTGTEHYLGAAMFWDHADTATYLRWLEAAGLAPIWHRFVPEGDSGHTLILARAVPSAAAPGRSLMISRYGTAVDFAVEGLTSRDAHCRLWEELGSEFLLWRPHA